MRTKRIFAVITAAIVILCGIGFTNAEAAELKLKKSGSEVKALQLELITLGYLDNAHPTGYYGEAKRRLQASRKITGSRRTVLQEVKQLPQ